MGASEDSQLPDSLRQAHGIVAEQLAQLRALAEHATAETERISTLLRQAERQLDEVTIQHRSAAQRGSPQVGDLQARIVELRSQTQALSRSLESERRAQRQLDQLVRQIAMSSDVLTGPTSADDPWAIALRAQVIHGREEERARLAREVHDGPAQVLANSLMLLEACFTLAQHGNDQERLVLMLDRLRGATREGLQEVRRFIVDLRPGIVKERGLGEAIKEYARSYTNANSTAVTLDIEPLPRLPEDTELVLYRIVQEALQNASKYARGAPLTVRLARQEQRLVLTIRDEGPGFDPYEVARRAGRSNWGLTSMRERAELIGARFSIASRPGHGTEVLVTLSMTSNGLPDGGQHGR
jgi:two-component system, NarL family, sensor histidine kinase DegS